VNLLSALLLALVEQLGSIQWYEREEAHLTLFRLAPISLPAARRAALHSDPEVRRRAFSILEDAHLVGPCPLPWVDSLDADYPDRNAIIQTWLVKARDSGWVHFEGWPEYRQATVLWIQHLACEEKWPRQKIEALLARMVENERRICKEKGWQVAWLPVE
jgi:hypothetical protein